jgi:hypothetical protein
MESFSQCGQDIFVLSLLNKKNGTFLDLGCYLPKNINNTYLLEQQGWSGISLDITDYKKEWEIRKTPFIKTDCLLEDYEKLLKKYYIENVIDYLSLDMEIVGDRYKLLDIIMKTGYEFKVITIEHDSHLGSEYVNKEKIPQRNLLNRLGYFLLCSNVSHKDYPKDYYEDWWINPKFFDKKDYESWVSDKESFDIIFKKNNILYSPSKESQYWY